jgi:hypothetical protein
MSSWSISERQKRARRSSFHCNTHICAILLSKLFYLYASSPLANMVESETNPRIPLLYSVAILAPSGLVVAAASFR